MASTDEEEDCSRQLEQQHGSFVSRAVSRFAGRRPTCHLDGPNGGLLDWMLDCLVQPHLTMEPSLRSTGSFVQFTI